MRIKQTRTFRARLDQCSDVSAFVESAIGGMPPRLIMRLRLAVESHKFTYDSKTIPVTISVGVARAPRAGVTSPAEFVAVADETMYEAKRTGRNKVCVAS